MKKQKKIIKILAWSLFLELFFVTNALANGGATISWTAPTTNEDSSFPIDISGYRIYYGTSAIDCTAWDSASNQITRQLISLAPNHVDVAESATLKDSGGNTKRGYTFSNTNLLTPGQTYYFTVVAYDASNNFSKCVNDSGINKTASKTIFHSGNIKNGGQGSGVVGLSDLSILAADYGKTSWCRIAGHPSDIDGNCVVGLSDLSILASEYGL